MYYLPSPVNTGSPVIDLNSTTHFADRINHVIDAALVDEPREKRNYLGASLIGGACERQIQYQAMHAPRDPGKGFPPRVLRCFERGHWLEAYAVKLLRNAGFILLDVDPRTGQQWEFTLMGGRVAGHYDGIIPMWRGPGASPIPLPVLWECKCLNKNSAGKAVKDKLRVSHNKYFNQVQINMGEYGLSHCLFTICNADSMEFHHELIPYEPSAHKAMVERAGRVLLAMDMGEMLVRGFPDRSAFECKYCDWSDQCWGNK